MKEYFVAVGMIAGLFFLLFSEIYILPVTLINNYLIYGFVFFIGFLTAVIYIFINKHNINDSNEYIFIPIRSVLSVGLIVVFSFLWINYKFCDNNETTFITPIVNNFINKQRVGGKYSSRVVYKSGFKINYKGQNKNIIWDSMLEDSIMNNAKEIQLTTNKGFFGIDIIKEKRLGVFIVSK